MLLLKRRGGSQVLQGNPKLADLLPGDLKAEGDHLLLAHAIGGPPVGMDARGDPMRAGRELSDLHVAVLEVASQLLEIRAQSCAPGGRARGWIGGTIQG